MPIARRCLDSLFALGLVPLLLAGSMVASCSSDDDLVLGSEADAGVDAGELPNDASTLDAGDDDADAALPSIGLPRSDAGAPPIVCATSPCAKSLVTTLNSEGFCALLDDGTVACWGVNESGQLGRGAAGGTTTSPTPARVPGLTNVVALDHTCAVDTSGKSWCWGKGPFLRSTTQPTTTQTSPIELAIPPATKVAVTETTACAVLEDGGMLCWGTNSNGQVATPAPDASTTVPLAPRAITLPPGAPIRALRMGSASFVLREDGSLVTWGATPPLGRVSSLFPDPHPSATALAGVSSIDIEGANACAVSEGIAYCWGAPYGPVANEALDNALDRALPEPVATPEPLVQIATTRDTAIATMPQRQCGVGVSGAVYCWGNNSSGQAGDGTTTYAPTPVKVAGLPAAAAEVRTTPLASCALLTSGKIFCWGNNDYGQLGAGKTTRPNLVPQEIVSP